MEKDEIKILRVDASDIENILALQRAVTENIKIKEWFVPSTKAELELAFSHPEKFPALKVLYKNELIAFSYIILNPDESNDIARDLENENLQNCCVYETVFVSPLYRGNGLQSLLISKLTDIAKQNGKDFIVATVHPQNIFSSSNFIKNGYTKLNNAPLTKYGSVRDYYGKRLN